MNINNRNLRVIHEILDHFFPDNQRKQSIALNRLEEVKTQILFSKDKLLNLFKSVFISKVQKENSLPELIVFCSLLDCSIEFKGANEFQNPLTVFSKFKKTLRLTKTQMNEIIIESVD